MCVVGSDVCGRKVETTYIHRPSVRLFGGLGV
jgi:hypothetical protein